MSDNLVIRRQAEITIKEIEENALVKLPKGKRPSHNTIERCHNKGLNGQKLALAVDIVNRYRSGLDHIARWLEEGIAFDVIPWLLEYKKVHNFSDSILLLAKYFNMLGFHIPNPGEEDVQLLQSSSIPLDEIIETFQEVAEVIGTYHAHYEILEVVVGLYEGDVHRAYEDALDDFQAFVYRVHPSFIRPLRMPEDVRNYINRHQVGNYTYSDGPSWEELEIVQ